MKTKYALTPVLLSCLLAACGGGSSDAPASDPSVTPAPAATTTDSNTGSVSAPFVRSASARNFLLGVSSQQFGRLDLSAQDASGAITTFGSTVLSGSTATKEISGDANFAQGRWAVGTVTKSSGAEILTGTGNAYHYLAYNGIAALPQSGSASCDTGTFTAPTYISGTATSTNPGTSTGSASIVFSAAGAAVTGSINSTANASAGSASLNTNVQTASSTSITGGFLSGSTGSAVAIGTDGGSGYVVAVGYLVKLANGANYMGVANFHCK